MKTLSISLPALKREVTVRTMQVKEFDLLTNKQKMMGGEALDELFKNCIQDQDINLDNLLSADRNALLIGIRRATFGDLYEFAVKSPYASSEKPQVFEINLSELEYRSGDRELVEKRLQDPQAKFPFTLPSGKKILWRFTDGSDFKKALKILKGETKATQDLLLRIVEVEGLKEEGIPLKRFVSEMDYEDMAEFNEYYEEKTPAIDDKIELICQETGELFTVKFEINVENFFKRNSRKKT